MNWGYVDRSGNMAIATRYDHAGPFHQGRACVRLGRHLGFIERHGEFVIPAIYGQETQGFSQDRAVVQDVVSKKCGYVDRQGEQIVAFVYDWAGTFSEDFARVRQGELFGFIDSTGRVCRVPVYVGASPFQNGFAQVDDGDGLYWFVDREFNAVFGPFEASNSFNEGRATVKLSGQWGILSKTGDVMFFPGFTTLGGVVSEGLVMYYSEHESGLINLEGQVVVRGDYAYVSWFREGLAPARRANGKWGYLRPDGSSATRFVYDSATHFSQGWAHVSQIGQSYFIDEHEDIVLTSSQFEFFGQFSEDLLAVRRK